MTAHGGLPASNASGAITRAVSLLYIWLLNDFFPALRGSIKKTKPKKVHLAIPPQGVYYVLLEGNCVSWFGYHESAWPPTLTVLPFIFFYFFQVPRAHNHLPFNAFKNMLDQLSIDV